MADNTFVQINPSGDFEEKLAIDSSAGIIDANKIVATGADGKIDISLTPREVFINETPTLTYPAISYVEVSPSLYQMKVNVP